MVDLVRVSLVALIEAGRLSLSTSTIYRVLEVVHQLQQINADFIQGRYHTGANFITKGKAHACMASH